MLDYGAGNVRSLINAVNRLGYEIEFIKDPSDFAKAEVWSRMSFAALECICRTHL